MADRFIIDLPVLQNYIAQYKASFAEYRLGKHQEIFKWRAVKCFQEHWDLEAADFATMLKKSLAKTGNLLLSANYYPRKMIELFADAKPEDVRSMFRTLFDESQDLIQRAKIFEAKAIKLLEAYPNYKVTHQDPNSISTYLWLRYPDKYYIYKYSVTKDNAQKLCHLDLPTGKFDRMVFNFGLYDAICKVLARDDELVALSKNSLTEDCYIDDQLKTLTIDMGYFISQHDITEHSLETAAVKSMDKNTILYGPPGTGKTYHAAQYAVSMIEEKPLEKIKEESYKDVFKRYLKYKEDGLIAFTTFHQSFGYEEFIEGIRPVLADEENSETSDIEYELYDGIFKSFCDKANIPLSDKKEPDLGINKNPTVWKVSLEGTGDNPTRRECMDNNHIRIGWAGAYGRDITDKINSTENFNGKAALNAFYNKMKIGDIVMSCYSNQAVDAIGVITGDPEWHEEYDDDYKRLRKVNWLVKGINEDIVEMNAGKVLTLLSVYRLSISVADVLQILRKTKPFLFALDAKLQNRVFIIDEINRGNISKIFGELITLLEPSKRIGATEELKATLPYSGQLFGVPNNVYILGTMNTADRSIALIDTALRRRFSFIEMQPDSAVFEDVLVEGLDIAEMLDTINKRITVLLDREHTIGHSYLLPLKDNPTLEVLADIFETKIVPLLQEYFYDDYEKIQLVLGDNQKEEDRTCFVVKKTDTMKLFGEADIDCSDYYELNKDAFMTIEAYKYLS